VHSWDAYTPVEETLATLDDLVHQGKARYLGISNFTGWQVAKATGRQRHHGWAPFVTIQPQYSLITRDIERDVLPAALDAGLGVLPWGPLGGGFLSGKYHRDRPPPPDSRISTATDDMEEAWARRATERNWAIVNAVQQVAEQTGHSMPQVAINWLLTRQGVTAPILGARPHPRAAGGQPGRGRLAAGADPPVAAGRTQQARARVSCPLPGGRRPLRVTARPGGVSRRRSSRRSSARHR